MRRSDDVVVFDSLNAELDAQSEALDVGVLGMAQEHLGVHLSLLAELFLACSRSHELERTEEAR